MLPPDPRSGWKVTVIRARRDIERSLEHSPSLRAAVAGMIADEMPSIRKLVGATLQRMAKSLALKSTG